MSRNLFLILGKTGGDEGNAVGDCHVDGTVAPIGDEKVDLRHDLRVRQK
jgi:hypothetical protein